MENFDELSKIINSELRKYGDNAGFCYLSPENSEKIEFNSNKPFMAASVIKIPVLVHTLLMIEKGNYSENDEYIIKNTDKLPSCGALTYMHDGLTVTIKDLYTLMIILSDNTATNILIKMNGIENINDTMKMYGVPSLCINRLLFDSESSEKDIQNYVTARDISLLFEKMLNRELVSKEASQIMLQTLKNQRLNSKMPHFLRSYDVQIAHKTGEDDGITHDAGIVYAKKPFIASFLYNGTDTIKFENTIQNITLLLYERNAGYDNKNGDC